MEGSLRFPCILVVVVERYRPYVGGSDRAFTSASILVIDPTMTGIKISLSR